MSVRVFSLAAGVPPDERVRTMKKTIFAAAVLFFLGIFGMPAVLLPAETPTPSPDELYGQGVYLFFNGRYDESVPYFRRAAEADPENPANYYFLGLSQWRMGDNEEAKRSFTKGAEAEQTPRGRLIDIPGHLIRIQGNERTFIENVRREVSRSYQEKERLRREALYGSDIQQQRRRLAASLAAGAAEQQVPSPDANLPSVPPIRPLFTPEVDGYISEELASADKEGFISLQKDERLDENGNVVKLDYLSIEAKKRAERRRTVAEERRIAKETFVDVFDTENTSSDNTTFDGQRAAATMPAPKQKQ